MKTQRDKILQILRTVGRNGVSSYDLTYKHYIKQAPTRVKELRNEGYMILSEHRQHPKPDRRVYYVLVSEPKQEKTKEQPKYEWVFDNVKNTAWKEARNPFKPEQTTFL